MQDTINCPTCNTEIDVKKALQNQVSGQVNLQYKERYAAKDAELKAREKAVEEKEFSKKSQEKHNQSLIDKGVEEAIKKIKPSIEKDIGSKFETVLEKAAEDKKALLAFEQKAIEEEQDKLTREDEQKLREDKVRVDEAKKLRTEFEKQREIDKKEYAKQMELQRLENEETMKQMENTFQKGVRQVSQGSMQIQGEAAEISVENFLNETYPFDTIESIKPGAKGADYLQYVSDFGSNTCGTIYIEVKRHKDFKPAWIPKFKNDIREKNADIGVLVTEVMPKGVTKPILMDGIWVCSMNDYEFIIECLRQNLIELRKVKVINENALDKQALVYQFVTSKEFARIMEALYEHFLEEEKSINYDDRLWQQSLNKRRKRLEMDNKLVGQLVGAFQSYCGDSISEIKSLEMSEVEEEVD